MARPVIGIATYAQPARFGAWELPAALVPLMYVEAVEQAGGRPLLVPPSLDAVSETLDVLDGLVLAGGADLDAGLYGAEPHGSNDPAQGHRDQAELLLLEAALDRDLPVLGICRGSQLLNVVRGGTLVQHLPDEVGHHGHKEEPGVFSQHAVRIDESTRVGSVLGPGADIKSHHHQGLGRVGEGLVAAAWDEDGLVEAVEDPERRFAVGVLWHPEADEDRRLFEALVAEARSYRNAVGRADQSHRSAS